MNCIGYGDFPEVITVSDITNAEKNEVIVDVREELRAGKEPFQKIMAAATGVPVGGKLVLYATFKPVPLIAVLKSQGFEGEPTKIDGGDWRVDFERMSGPVVSKPTDSEKGLYSWSENDQSKGPPPDIMLDNRGLEPPQPMVRTLEAIVDLKDGQRIIGEFDRTPMFLLPKLEEMGYSHEVDQKEDGKATVTIWK